MRKLILFLLLYFLIGCSSPVKQFDTYYIPVQNKNLEIEVICHYGTNSRFELFIDKQYVMDMPVKMFDYHIESKTIYKGNIVEMKGEFFPARGFIVDVFFNKEHASNFVFF